MKAFLSIKFWGDDRNREDAERICRVLERLGLTVYCFRRDAEQWGELRYAPSEMMERTFAEIDSADIVIADVADWPIGVGVEAGYAHGKGIPVVCIAPSSSRIAGTVAGISVGVIQYEGYDDLETRMSVLLSALESARRQ